LGIQIPKTYEPADVESRLYQWWERQGWFRADSDSEAETFSIVMPPPNVTGSLHMGHALNCTLQDILCRWKRMMGCNVLWLPGTDHAGIATQNVVERRLAEEGRHRTELGREKFEELVWEWKERSEKNILGQIRTLGCSCDWSRLRFTLDEGLSRAVREVFVRLYDEGLIYRGDYLVNWCPRCSTAISDLEVEYEAKQGKLWHLRYPVKDSREFVVVATTRPETMLGDTAVAVHPKDPRYSHLAGKSVVLPLMEREIPVIFDEFVDREFGTGIVKVTPGHDPNDFEAGRRHDLEVVLVIGEDAKMTESAGAYAGLDRFEARRKVVADLDALGLLEKVEEHAYNLGHCQRCHTLVEPLVSRQWFVRVQPLARPAMEAVSDGRAAFVSDNFRRIYFDWMENIHDWCISRQLWWGHRIPAWTCSGCQELIVAREAPATCTKCGGQELAQESDVLDTWFSSALWPFSTLGWPEETADLKRFYPTTALVTGPDIIFFWVARMMMMGLKFRGDVPFRQIYISGLVRDEKGQKMSKSRGNIIDPLEIIPEYGTDAVRFTLSVMAVPGGDIPFSVSRMAGYRAFCNKIWNAGRFLLLHLEPDAPPVDEADIDLLMAADRLRLEDSWILGRLHQTIERTRKNLTQYFFHEAANELYHFFWHELCDWYIELIKIDLTSDRQADRDRARTVAICVLETSLRLLHPFIPFITEELWQKVPHRGETIMIAPYPELNPSRIDSEAIEKMQNLQETITAIRTVRAQNMIDPRKKLSAELRCPPEGRKFLDSQLHHLQRLAQLDEVRFVKELPKDGLRVLGVSRLADFSLSLDQAIDLDAELERINKQLEKARNEMAGHQKRLQNQSFLEKAPEAVVEGARRGYNEALEKAARLEEKISRLQQQAD
jgi:valyl-tRNA synthetase